MKGALSDRNSPEARTTSVLLVLTVLTAFALRLYQLDQQSLSWDEIKSVQRASMTLAELLADLQVNRQQVPFYYLLLRLWAPSVAVEFSARFLSVLIGTVSVPLIYQLGRVLAGKWAGLMAALFLAISPFHIWYSQEARMYVLLVASLLLAHYFLFRAVRSSDWLYWIRYVIAMIVAVYSHYFAFLVLMSHYISFALHFRRVRDRSLRWLLCATAIGLAFSPWAVFIMTTGGYNQAVPRWIRPVGLSDLFLTLFAFSAGSIVDAQRLLPYLALAIYLLGMVFAMRHSLNTSSSAVNDWLPDRQLVLWFVTPLFVTFLVSLGVSGLTESSFSLYMDRYLIVILPSFIILAVLGLERIARHWKGTRWLAAAFVVLGTAPALFNLYFAPEYWRTDWRAMSRALENRRQPGDVILAGVDQLQPLTHYGSRATMPLQLPPPPPPSPPEVLQEAFEEAMTVRVGNVVGEAACGWLITPVYPTDTHGFMQERNRLVAGNQPLSAHQKWMEENYQRRGLWRFTGLQLSVYDLSNEDDETCERIEIAESAAK